MVSIGTPARTFLILSLSKDTPDRGGRPAIGAGGGGLP